MSKTAPQEGSDRSAETTTGLNDPENDTQMRVGEGVGGNRRELRNAHAEAESGEGGQQHERQIVGPSHEGQTADAGHRERRAEREHPPAAETIRANRRGDFRPSHTPCLKAKTQTTVPS